MGHFCRHRSAAQRFFVATTNNHGSDGDEAYRMYLDANEQLKKLQEDQERIKSQKMYQAWQKASNAQKNPASTGVAVVRTLAKQSKKQSNQVQILRERANSLLRTAADKFEHPEALVQLGNFFLQSDNAEKALDCYKKAGRLGRAEGWFNLGHCLWEGIGDTVKSDRNGAMDAFEKAIALGDADAMYFVAVHLLGLVNEDGSSNIDKSKLQKALDWIEQAGELGHGGALYYSALFYRNGFGPLGIPPCLPDVFVERLNRAVDADTTGDAHFFRGSSYWAGDDGLSRDPAQALRDFLKASDLGHADAAVSAGAILHQGVPGFILQDQSQAFALYQHAGELGSLEAWRNVVACYAKGEGVEQSIETAQYIAKTMLKEETAGRGDDSSSDTS